MPAGSAARGAFTQGLEYRGGFLNEGTGLNGRSIIRKVELATGRVVQQQSVGADYFGEGITIVGDVGVTSHFGDLLREAKIPSRVECDDSEDVAQMALNLAE